MKIDHISVYREPRPTRVSFEERMGHRSSVTAAGTVPAMRPRRTTPNTHRLGVLRTCHHERTKSITEVNIQTKNTGERFAEDGTSRAEGLNAFDDVPLRTK